MRIFMFSSLVARFSLFGCYSFSDDYCSVSYTLKIILQDYVNLEIIKKRGSSINPDIHHSKVFSSVVSQKYADRKISRKHEAVFFSRISPSISSNEKLGFLDQLLYRSSKPWWCLVRIALNQLRTINWLWLIDSADVLIFFLDYFLSNPPKN